MSLLTLRTLFVQDLSGRPHLSFDLQIPTQRVGTYDTQVGLSLFTSTSGILMSTFVSNLSSCAGTPAVIMI